MDYWRGLFCVALLLDYWNGQDCFHSLLYGPRRDQFVLLGRGLMGRCWTIGFVSDKVDGSTKVGFDEYFPGTRNGLMD
jgi:hypothetical protein